MPTTVRSHAKINLGLYIGAPRPDGFHELATVYQTLEIHDLVTVTARNLKNELPASPTIRITSNDPRVPTDETNTAWRMIDLALQDACFGGEVDIHIEKCLPVQGGLGAGSANAAAALVALEKELGAPIRPPMPDQPAWQVSRDLGILNHWTYWVNRRLEIAAEVGSDVPLFLIGGTVLGLDHGQEVYPLPDLDPTWCVVVAPSIGVSTPQAFRDWDTLCASEGLTHETSADKLQRLSRAYAGAFAEAIPGGRQGTGSSGVLSSGEDLAGPATSALVRTGITSWIENDFERVVFPQQPILRDIKRLLAASDTPEAALHASLSGSGSALYGLFATRGEAEAAKARVEAGVELPVQCTVTRTLPRSAYWQGMLLQK